jgi:tRNA A37 threonylcarbamoyladenosine synthetase subunit TsaC/SUA5/YrdC
VDGGAVDTGARPTIVSVAGGRLELLREGAIPPAEIETGAGVKFGG